MIMEKIAHPFLLSLKAAFQSSDKLFMVTEYCSGGEVFFHLKKLRRFTEVSERLSVCPMIDWR